MADGFVEVVRVVVGISQDERALAGRWKIVEHERRDRGFVLVQRPHTPAQNALIFGDVGVQLVADAKLLSSEGVAPARVGIACDGIDRQRLAIDD